MDFLPRRANLRRRFGILVVAVAQEGFAYLKDGYDDIDYERSRVYWRRCEDCVGESFWDESVREEWSIRDMYVCCRCEDVLELMRWPPGERHVLDEGR